jgi:hypothetical protein
MTKAEKSLMAVSLNLQHQAEAQELILKLAPALPNWAVVAIDCVPNKHLNAFHYVDGRKDLNTLAQLSPERKEELISLKKMTEKFKVNYPVGERAGLWQLLTKEHYQEEIDWEIPFVIKKTNGEMMIFDPSLIAKKMKGKINAQDVRHHGASNKAELIKFLYTKGANYYQQYFSPLPGPVNPCRNATYRLLFHFSNQQKATFIGGFWISGYKLRIKNEDHLRTGLVTQ